MLTHLTIKNIVLIEKLTLDFNKGFSALTGETGAGKSILLDSLGLAIGYRADAGLVRKGAEQAAVIGSFDIPANHPLKTFFEKHDLEFETPVILRRTLNKDGRSKAFVNDQPVSASLLRDIGARLVEIHGQFDTQGLLDQKTHRALLDNYAGLNLTLIKSLWKTWQNANKALIEAREKIEQSKIDEDYLRQSLEDLDRINPIKGEAEELKNLRNTLMNREKVIKGFTHAYHALSDDDGADTHIGKALRHIEDLHAFTDDETLSPIIEALDRASSELQDAAGLLQSALSDIEFQDQSLEDIDDRLYDLQRQAQKHNCEMDELPDKREEIAEQLAQIDHQDEHIADLIKAADQAKSAYKEEADKISKQRSKAAQTLSDLVHKELPPLKMDRAQFLPQVVPSEGEANWGQTGYDSVTFMVATNTGTEPGPLNKIASGGEMSRFMLALKVIMAEKEKQQKTLIFDEVDAGIGGATADAVGIRLRKVSNTHQILVVTHSPQVAAKADNHYMVMKGDSDNGNTIRTTVLALPEAHDRREEIARMLSGADITDAARAAADTLMKTGT